MKKRMILGILAILLVSVLSFIAANLQTVHVVQKEEKRFCANKVARPAMLLPQNRKLIRNGSLSFESQDLDASRQRVENAMKQYKGYISSERIVSHDYNHSTEQEMTLRVPAEHFEALLNMLMSGNEKLIKRSVSIDDVTSRYLDIETRLQVKRELETRYRKLLESATEVKDMLAIEEQIGILREDIESAEQQLSRFDDEIAFSSLEVSFIKKEETGSFSLMSHVKNGFKNGWKNLNWLVIGLINIWPFLLIIGGVVVGIRHKRTKKNG